MVMGLKLKATVVDTMNGRESVSNFMFEEGK